MKSVRVCVLSTYKLTRMFTIVVAYLTEHLHDWLYVQTA